VQRLGPIAPAIERLRELVDFGARATEHDGRRRILDVEHAAERGDLVRAPDDVRHLAHARRGARGDDLAIDAHPHRIIQMLLGELGDARRKCRGEERGLPVLGGRLQNRLEVLGEAHVEHLVRLVEHHDLHRIEAQRLAPDVVERATGRGDDDVDPALEHAQLILHRRAAIDRQHAHAERLAVLVHRLGDLHRELARGDEDERRRTLARIGVRRHQMQQRKRERRGLARARRGLAEHVATGEQRRDRFALHRRRFLVAERGERIDETRIEAERGKAGALLGGFRCGGAWGHRMDARRQASRRDAFVS
jgi:hypothetical protein